MSSGPDFIAMCASSATAHMMMSPQQRANAAMCVAGLQGLQIANPMLLRMACWDDDHVAEPVTNDSHLHRIDERSHHDMMELTRALSSIGSS
jgi:hypothetical protein